MAPTFTHGKVTKVLINGQDASSWLNSVTFDASADAVDTTVYALGDKRYIAGQGDGTISMSGFFDASTAEASAVVGSALGGSTDHVVSIFPAGNTVGAPALLAHAIPTAYAPDAPVSDAVSISLDFQANDGVHLGAVLRALSASTSSTGSTGETVNISVSTATDASTKGCYGALHVTTGSTFSVTEVIQHSSDTGAGWSDLLTFTAATGTGSQYLGTTGTVKEKVRTHTTAFGGGASNTATYAVAFSVK